MKDLFICPSCGKMTEFEGASADEGVAEREIRCECGAVYLIAVNFGCRVLAFEVKASPKNGPRSSSP